MNSSIITFPGRSVEGAKTYTMLCGCSSVQTFWVNFARDSKDLDACLPSIVRSFLGLSTRKEPTRIIEHWVDTAVVSSETIHHWFLCWRNLDTPYPDYFRRRMMHMAIYAVRYALTIYDTSLSQKQIKLIQGKELATFLLDEWTGDGIVGIMSTSDGSRTLVKEFCFANSDLARIYCDYFESGVATVRASEFNALAETFENSLGEYAENIHAYGDFSEGSLLHQVAYYHERFLDNPAISRKALRHVVGFYRYLVGTEEGSRIFDEGNFSVSLLKNMTVLRYLSEGWAFRAYRAISPASEFSRLVIVLKDEKRLGTRFLDGDALAIDLSKIETPFYRNVVWKYLRSNRQALLRYNEIRYIAMALHVLEESKRKTHKNLCTLCSREANLLKAIILNDQNREDITVKWIMGVLRRFFEWTTNSGLLVADSKIPLSCLRYRAEPGTSSRAGRAVPIEDINRILDRMAKEAERSHRARLIYVITIIQATTRIRPSEICKMDIRSILLEQCGNYYKINDLQKTSRGNKVTTPISTEVYQALSSLIADSAEMRERCYDPVLRNMVFLYEGTNGFTRIKEQDYKLALAQTCDALGLPHWRPYDLRRTVATVWDELDRELEYHGELAAQAMGHKHYSTTREHYIDRTFEEFRRVQDADQISTDEMLLKEYQRLMEDGKI